LLQDQIRLAHPLELAQKRNEGPHNNYRLAGTNVSSVKGIDSNFKFDLGMRAALPAQRRKGVHGRDTYRPPYSIFLPRLIKKIGSAAPAHFAGKRHSVSRTRATHGVRDRPMNESKEVKCRAAGF
jgi:hypothetical protein